MTFLACLTSVVTLGFLAKYVHLAANGADGADLGEAILSWLFGIAVNALLLWASITLWVHVLS